MSISVNIIVFTTDIPNNKKFVLSIDAKEIVFPKFSVTKENRNDIDKQICDLIRNNYMYLSDMEILPQFITLNSENLCNEDSTLEVVYGCIVPLTSHINHDKCRWSEFDLSNQDPNSFLLLNVIRNLV